MRCPECNDYMMAVAHQFATEHSFGPPTRYKCIWCRIYVGLKWFNETNGKPLMPNE